MSARELDDIPVQPAFPCVFWRKGSLFRAPHPEGLYGTLPSYFKEWVKPPPDEWYLMDCSGRCFDISGCERIRPFGGSVMAWIKRILDGIVFVFAVPVLTNERQLTLDQFKRTLLYAATWRYFYDRGRRFELDDIRAKVRKATSYLEVIDALPWHI